LSQKVKEARNKLIELIAHIEVTVDYPEHDIEEITGQMVYEQAQEVKYKLQDLLKNFDRGRILREGITAVITGKPNVGKSSLLNELSGRNKAIVTDIPGTTRDIIEEYINISGMPVRLVDTAGIRETDDIIEQIGVERAKREFENADLIIMMIDAKEGTSHEDHLILESIKNKKAIIVINKIDLVDENRVQSIKQEFSNMKVVTISLKDEIGAAKIEKSISVLFEQGAIAKDNEILLTNVRHKDLIDKALNGINEACGAYEAGMPLDCITIDIRNAAEYLGQITGESIAEDVADNIFKRFCIGK
jgi:tRNA modification GTPase